MRYYYEYHFTRVGTTELTKYLTQQQQLGENPVIPFPQHQRDYWSNQSTSKYYICMYYVPKTMIDAWKYKKKKKIPDIEEFINCY